MPSPSTLNHEEPTLRRNAIPVALGMLLSLACSSTPDGAPSFNPSRQSTAALASSSDPEVSGKKDNTVATENSLVAVPPTTRLPPGLERILRYANAMSPGSDEALAQALEDARKDSANNARVLRDKLRQPSGEPGEPRRLYLWILGQIGDDSDVPVLEATVQSAPRSLQSIQWDVDHHAVRRAENSRQPAELPSEEDESTASAHVEAVQALHALVGLASRGSGEASRGLDRLIESAEPNLSQLAALSLHVNGKLTSAHRAALRKRNIPHGFRRLTPAEEARLDVASDNNASTGTPLSAQPNPTFTAEMPEP